MGELNKQNEAISSIQNIKVSARKQKNNDIALSTAEKIAKKVAEKSNSQLKKIPFDQISAETTTNELLPLKTPPPQKMKIRDRSPLRMPRDNQDTTPEKEGMDISNCEESEVQTNENTIFQEQKSKEISEDKNKQKIGASDSNGVMEISIDVNDLPGSSE